MAELSIVLIEDEWDVAEAVQTLLESEGHLVRVASNGAAGLELVGAASPDLVLLDIMMPVMDGASVLRRLRSSPDTRNLPVILMSALSPAEVRRLVDSRYQGLLRKPFRFEALLAAISRALGEPG